MALVGYPQQRQCRELWGPQGKKNQDNFNNFQAEMQQSDEAGGNVGLHQIPPGLYMEHFQIHFSV